MPCLGHRCQRDQPLKDFLRKHLISGCSGAIFVVMNDGLSKAWSLGKPGRPRDDRVKDFRGKVLPYLPENLLRQPGPAVEHRHDDTQQLQSGVRSRVAHLIEHPMDHRNAFQSVIFTLQRNHEPIGGREGVQGHDAQRWRTIDDDKVETVGSSDGVQSHPKSIEMVIHLAELDFGSAQIHFAGHHVKVLKRGGLYFFGQEALAEKWSIRAGALYFFKAHPAGRIGLGIHVHQENALPKGSEASG